MRRYRAMVYIPETMTPPGGSPATVTSAQRLRAVNVAARLPERLAEASDGMATVDVTIRSVTQPLGSDYYRYVPSGAYMGYWPEAGYIAQLFGEQTAYDFWLIFTPYSMLLSTPTVPGLAAVNTAWIGSNSAVAMQVCLHELMHLIGHHIEVDNDLTYGWPVCELNDGPTRGLHCAQDYGYPTTIDPKWLDDYGRGVVDGNLGFDADKWAILTPTEEGNRTLPGPNRVSSSVWGSIGAIVVPPVPEP